MAEKFATPWRAGIKRAALWLFWPALAVVAWGELRPVPELPDLGWDKLLHFAAYFGLALLATLGWGRRIWAITIFAAVVVIGGIMEILQAMVGRSADWQDMIANSLGAGTGTALAVLLLHLARLVDARRGQ